MVGVVPRGAAGTVPEVPTGLLGPVATPLQSLPLLPEGFALPPPVYLVPVVVSLAMVVALLWALQPPVTDWTVPALVPWMLTGAALHVLFQQRAFREAVLPLLGTPTVYLTTAVGGGLVWAGGTVLADFRTDEASVDRILGIVGAVTALSVVGYSLWLGSQAGGLTVFTIYWSALGLLVAVLVSAVAWFLLSLRTTDAVVKTGKSGLAVVSAQALDGVSTAVGVDVFDAGERTPLSRAIIEFTADLEVAGVAVASVAGTGWLFVLVKVALAMVIVVAFAEYVADRPRAGRLALAALAAVGLGPGAHNLLLFVVGGG